MKKLMFAVLSVNREVAGLGRAVALSWKAPMENCSQPPDAGMPRWVQVG